ncbi:MAG: hypothetical protein L3J57_00335 [Desulfuromusa sp.]|nr:hypothetical protein [Desulfuromusa sp.]
MGTPARGSDSQHFNKFEMKKDEVSILSNGKFKLPLVFYVKEVNGKDVPNFRVTIFWKAPASVAWVGDKLVVQKWSTSRVATVENLSVHGGKTRFFRKGVIVEPYDGEVILKLDDNNKVAETENYDNTTAAEVSFPGLHYPDLIVKNLKVLTKHPVVGKPVQVEATITRLNDHNLQVTAREALQKEALTVGFRCGGATRLKIINTEISKLGDPSVNVRAQCNFSTRQNYLITVFADPRNRVKELNERNNKKSISLKVK